MAAGALPTHARLPLCESLLPSICRCWSRRCWRRRSRFDWLFRVGGVVSVVDSLITVCVLVLLDAFVLLGTVVVVQVCPDPLDCLSCQCSMHFLDRQSRVLRRAVADPAGAVLAHLVLAEATVDNEVDVEIIFVCAPAGGNRGYAGRGRLFILRLHNGNETAC